MALCSCALNKTLHCIQVAAKRFSVDLRVKALEVNIQGVHMREELLCRLIFHAAVCDQNGFQSLLPQKRSCIQDILIADRRLVIGKGDADVSAAAQFLRHVRQNVRREIM